MHRFGESYYAVQGLVHGNEILISRAGDPTMHFGVDTWV